MLGKASNVLIVEIFVRNVWTKRAFEFLERRSVAGLSDVGFWKVMVVIKSRAAPLETLHGMM